MFTCHWLKAGQDIIILHKPFIIYSYIIIQLADSKELEYIIEYVENEYILNE